MKFKSLLTFLAGAALTVNAQAQVFSTTFASQEEFNQWTVIDNNGDEKTWYYQDPEWYGENDRVVYSYHSLNTGDDWLISPAITVPEDGQYIVYFNYKGGSYQESIKVAVATENTVEALSANFKFEDDYAPSALTAGHIFFEATAGQTVYLGFYACSIPDQFKLTLGNVSVEKCDNPTNLIAKAITAPKSGENLGQETLKVLVENGGFSTIETFEAVVKVDGVEVFTETFNTSIPAGEEMELTFTNKLDLSKPHHGFNIEVTFNIEGEIVPGDNTVTGKVSHIAPAAVPYFTSFEPDEQGIDSMNIFDVNGDYYTWDREEGSGWWNLAHTGVGCMSYNYNKTNAADDWFILEGVSVEPGFYAVKYWYCSGDDRNAENLEVYWGTTQDPAQMTNKIAVHEGILNPEYSEAINIIEVKEACTLYLGFHCFSEKDKNWLIVDDVTIDPVDTEAFDLIVSNLQNPVAYIPAKATRDVVVDVQNFAVIDATAQVQVKVDNQVVATKDITLLAQQKKTVVIENALAEVAAGTHTIEVVATANGTEDNTENNSVAGEFRIMPEADLVWDFEDGEFPANFNYRIEDTGILASSEFGEQGIGIVEIQEHPQFGEYMLAASTWFTEPGRTADRWIVLPQLTVNSEDAAFVVNMGAMSLEFNERVSIQVSDREDTWSDYRTKLDVTFDENRFDYGVDLGENVGKNIYVALRVNSYDGDCISFDNFNVYGCTIANTAIDGVFANEAKFVVKGNTLAVEGVDAVKSLEVYDIAGRLLASTTEATLNVSNLSAGVYVAKATTENGTYTLKFNK